MSTALDRIIEETERLSDAERRELLQRLERDERTAELRRIQRKYARLKTSSKDFAKRKAEEIELEDRPRR